jgi:hypothetical protein
MKKILFYIILAIQSACLLSCYKDLGNYKYHDINELTFTSFDTVNGYTAYFGDTLSISPVLNATQDTSNRYTYQWSFNDQLTGDRVISTDKDLKIRVAEQPGLYTLQYKVTDLNTGVLFHIKTTLLVKTDVYEGYLVLNDVDGTSRLDMLSYDVVAGKFIQYTDVLKKMGSSLPAQGQPYKVLCTRVSNAFSFSDSTYGIYLLTASGTNRVHPETFDWRPTYNIRYEITGNISQDFKADNLIADPAFYFISLYMVSGNNVYVRSGGVPLYNLPLNKYVGQPIFNASPYVVGDGFGGSIIMYDTDSSKYAMLPSANSSNVIDMPAPVQTGDIPFRTKDEMVWMDKNASGYAYAITRVPNTTQYWLTKFQPGSLPVYEKQILGTDIDKASFFAVSSIPEYLFYSVGGKVYEYDLYLNTSKLMLDKGAAQISYLNFDKFSATDAQHATVYGQWAKWLTIGSYDPAGATGANGTLEQYSIVDAHEPLVFQRSWTGFGKIASISYRER